MAVTHKSLPEGAISFDDIQDVFGGTNPISLNEYYKGGLYVKDLSYNNYYGPLSGSYVPNIPTSGAISTAHFQKASKAYTYSQGTTPVITGFASSVSISFSITSYLPDFKRNTGDTFLVSCKLRSETNWIQLPYLHVSFTVGTAKSTNTPQLHSKQYIMKIAYNGASTITLSGYYSGSSTNYPNGGVYLQGIVSTS
jgi:hypothetical protein